MANVGALNYKVSANVAGFQSGMVLSRSELALTRREMTASRSDAEKLQYKLDTLEKAYKAGAIELEQYEATQVSLRARSQEGQAAAAAEAEALRKASDLTRKLATDEEKLAEERRQLIALQPHVSAETYGRALEDINRRMPEAIASEKARADALAASEKREKELVKAQKDRKEERIAKQQQLLNQQMAEGRRVTQSVETATEKYSREMQQLDRLLRRGAISQETHARAMKNHKRDLDSNRMAMASQLPVIGNLSSSVLSASASFGPAGIAIAVAAAELYVFAKATQFVIGQITEQMDKMDRQAEKARQLYTDLDKYQVLLFAADRSSGADEGQVDAVISKLTLNFAKAADGNKELRSTIQGLGLDVDSLSKKDPAIIFEAVSEAISKLKNPAEQYRIIAELGGKSAVAMADTFRLGADGLASFTDRARELGLVMNESDVEQIDAAKDAYEDMSMSVDRLWNTLAVELSPAFQYAMLAVEGMGGAIADTGPFFASLIDVSRQATGLLYGLYDVAAGIITLDWDQLSSGISGDTTINFLKGIEAVEAANKKIADDRKAKRDADREAASQIENKEDDPTTNDKGTKKLQDQAEELLATERARLLELEKGKEAVEAEKLAKMELTDLQRQEIESIRAKTKALEAEKKEADAIVKHQREASDEAKRDLEQMQQRGRQIAESIKTPLENVTDEIRDIRKLRDVGAIDKRTADQAEIAAQKKFSESRKKEIAPTPTTATRGSREEYQILLDQQRGKRADEDRRHRETIDQQKIQEALLEKVVDAVVNLQPVGRV